MKILVVDDDNLVRSLMKKALVDDGHSVIDSCNGEDALKQLKNDAFDLVVTDNVIPNGGVTPIADHIISNLPKLPILVVSGGMAPSSRQEEASSALRTPHILYKPFKKKQFLDAVNHTLQDVS